MRGEQDPGAHFSDSLSACVYLMIVTGVLLFSGADLVYQGTSMITLFINSWICCLFVSSESKFPGGKDHVYVAHTSICRVV